MVHPPVNIILRKIYQSMSTLWACLNHSTHIWYYSLHVSLYPLEIIMGKTSTEALGKNILIIFALVMMVQPGLSTCFSSLHYCLLVVNNDDQHRVEKLCRHLENLSLTCAFLKCSNKSENWCSVASVKLQFSDWFNLSIINLVNVINTLYWIFGYFDVLILSKKFMTIFL